MRVDDKRGNNQDRKARKLWMLSTEAGFGGDGVMVPCVHGCGFKLDYRAVQADRREPGGSYRRDNIQPSCRRDNILRSNNKDWKRDDKRKSNTVPSLA